ncbi:PREDICTED: cystinosin homolog isoform X2 [Lupinus angustifolius]|uniref:cystinosin homolog isoform X2 n=1 Tax=Lupinus angustifolius TaxID=3871 RepID=UPI00092EC323|nr:PREDICTED: cystinosin homolog isoform X2 [Lupinus angustifolius]
MASWNSFPLEVTYQVLGWLAFLSWAICGYPQIILNFHRKSVVGLNLDYEILNMVKLWSYLIYNVSLFFSSDIQNQYFDKYGYGQCGTQKFSKFAITIVALVLLSAAVCFFIALPTHSWLWLISIFNTIQVCLTIIKYFPQALMNFMRKSTDGFSIGSILLDFSGGIFNYSQMVVQSIDQGSWMNFYGNIGKVMISLVTIFYDSILMFQHYVLYPHNKGLITSKIYEEIKQPLNSATQIDEHIKDSVKSFDLPSAEV